MQTSDITSNYSDDEIRRLHHQAQNLGISAETFQYLVTLDRADEFQPKRESDFFNKGNDDE